AREYLGARPDDDRHARLDVRIAGLADGMDVAVFETDVGLDDPPVVDDQRVGDHGVDRAALVGDLRLAHAVADHLAAAELHLFAVGREILLDLDDQIGVGEPHAVARGGSEHIGVGAPFDLERYNVFLARLNLSPYLTTGPVQNAVSIASYPRWRILFF